MYRDMYSYVHRYTYEYIRMCLWLEELSGVGTYANICHFICNNTSWRGENVRSGLRCELCAPGMFWTPGYACQVGLMYGPDYKTQTLREHEPLFPEQEHQAFDNQYGHKKTNTKR